MSHGIRISESSCHGCVNCIKSCPTEAIRVIDGSIQILDELCISCAECLRACKKNALRMRDDDWDLIRTIGAGACLADPAFFLQFGARCLPENIREEIHASRLHFILDEAEIAFDLCAYATAKSIEARTREQLPLISTYCPSVLRLIQLQFPELITRLVPVENPLEVAAQLWRERTGSAELITLFSPCPARINMMREPVGRKKSALQYVVSINKVVRTIQASGYKAKSTTEPMALCSREALWAVRGGESRQVKEFSKKPIKTLAVSGIRNTMDLLQELELGKLSGIDFVECRMCDTGCIGGVATPESRFYAILHTNDKTPLGLSSEQMRAIEVLFDSDLCSLPLEIKPKQRLPLSTDLSEAMALLNNMQDLHKQLPHIDCGACGRPSCQAMAEDIVRGNGKVSDCIFKLRESITSLAEKIVFLTSSQPNTIKKGDFK